jgi:hypothetical protein
VPGAVVRRWLGRGGLVLSLSLLPQVVVPSGFDFAAQAQPAAARKLEDRPDAKIDKVGVLKPGTSKAPKDKAAPAVKRTRERLKRAAWPTAGKATADVPAAGKASVTVGGLGVTLAQAPAAKSAQRKAVASGPAERVTLGVQARSAAQKAGVSGVLLTVAPSKAPPPTSSVSR